jgi:peptidoglycan-associated lipoprotein
MNAMNWLRSATLVGAGLVGGCAHQQGTTTLDTGAPAAPAQAQTEVPPPAEQQSSEALDPMGADFQALLKGTVIHFDFNQDVLTSDSASRLQALSDALRAHPAAKILISGNCDERGTEEYNIALGQRRADVAKAYLESLGVDGARIQTLSYGYERPVKAGHDENAWAVNRRDELQLQGS